MWDSGFGVGGSLLFVGAERPSNLLRLSGFRAGVLKKILNSFSRNIGSEEFHVHCSYISPPPIALVQVCESSIHQTYLTIRPLC